MGEAPTTNLSITSAPFAKKQNWIDKRSSLSERDDEKADKWYGFIRLIVLAKQG